MTQQPLSHHRIFRLERHSRLLVTNEVLAAIEDANKKPKEHNLMTDDSLVLDKDGHSLNESTQGAYVMKRRATGVPVGVFKPMEEELLSLPISPKLGVVVGDGAVKEQAAYVLDHGGRAGVPKTETVMLLERNLDITLGSSLTNRDASVLTSPTLGSFQEFREHTCTSEDLGSSLFSVDEVHYIALLDLRLFNLDRHLGNILVQSGDDGTYSLVPIDHGYILPSFRCLSDAWFCWSSWRQSMEPLSADAKLYVRSLNPFSDIATLKHIGLRDECILTYVLSTLFVQACVEHEWTLHRMAMSMQRDVCRSDDLSDFEVLVRTTSKRAGFDSFEFHESAASWGCAEMLEFLDSFEQVVHEFMEDPNSLR